MANSPVDVDAPRPESRWLQNPGRRAGLLYLSAAVLAPFSIIYVPGKLIVQDDAAATARNILAAENLYRASIVVGLISAVVFIFVAFALYKLFEKTSKTQATLMVTLVMMLVAVGMAVTVNDLAALTVLQGSDVLGAFTRAQREGLAMMFLRLSHQGTLITMIFWGLWLFPFGWLVIKSGLMPRILGVLLIVSGVAYVVLSFIGMMAPAYQQLADRIAFPAELGELWVILWLVIRGVPTPPGSAMD